jgi:hypothetical protein
MKKLLSISALAFVTAWIAGLMTTSNGPKPNATGATLKAYYSGHQHAAMLQTFCVDALAGLALIGLTLGLARPFSDPTTQRRIRIAGFTAAAISLFQAGIGEALASQGAGSGSPALVRTLFVTLNDADTIKIALLACLIAAVSLGAQHAAQLPRWLTKFGLTFAPVLAISGLAFPLGNDALYGLLYLTLPALLLWTATASIKLSRQSMKSRVATA